MLSKDTFIEFILKGAAAPAVVTNAGAVPSALPEGFDTFDVGGAEQTAIDDTTFARRLLEAADFGLPELVARDSVIRSTDAVARYLPDRVAYWPKTPSRPYQTLLFESTLRSDELLRIQAFRYTQLHHLNDLEAALARLVSQALDGFQRGGESVTADVRKGRASETLCVVSVVDTRDGQPVRLVCFGTENASSAGLETFSITEGTRFWDMQLAREHLGLLYERQFKKLAGKDWQEAFTTTEERNQAEKLLKVCTRKPPRVADIQEVVLDLLDTIAKGFGLKKKPNTERRLQAFELPKDHDIGIHAEEMTGKFGGHNPFGGVTLRDERSRLLGYIVYPLKAKGDATRLRAHLEANNRFHNVLVVYPDQDQASLELWQGREQLTGKLRKSQGYKDAADVVNLLSRFFVVSKAKVRSPAELAQELAYRARYLRRLAVKQLDEERDKGALRSLYNAFKEALVHEQTEDEFADAFAQTITYGLLTARWTGNERLVADGERLTRHTALTHLPTASPFLNGFFRSVLSVKLDEQRGRFLWLVDDIADLLDRVDVVYVFSAGDAGSDNATDPVIHFYEPFLAAYDKEIKNKRGVFFTPTPVVSFIVHSVHELLQSVFGLQDGLASTARWQEVTQRNPTITLPPGVKSAEPFVHILDPATGTGTFLFECIDLIERTMKNRWCRELNTTSWDHPDVKSRWNSYVPTHLLPRLTGYELMMAPYSIAHLKLSLKLAQTGYELKSSDRIHVYLTNSLEPPTDVQPTLKGFQALAEEAITVNARKRLHRYTVVIGNPPYSNFGQLNRNPFILDLLEDYKKGLGERKLNLDDDFIKFLRYGHYLITQVGAGVLGFITNNAFLDGITHRRMRQSLLTDFPFVKLVDLHGNIRKAEVDRSGGTDDNVFDIMQGVAIGVFATHSPSEPTVSLAHLQGSRQDKYDALTGKAADALMFEGISPATPYFLFSRMSGEDSREYEAGIPLSEVFRLYQSPIQTKRDHLTIHFSEEDLNAVLSDLRTKSPQTLRAKYELAPDGRDWTLESAIKDVKSGRGDVIRIAYKPFDMRYTYFSGKTKGFLAYPRTAVMSHMLTQGVRAFVFKRQAREDACGYTYFFVTDCPFSEGLFAIDPRGREFIAPLELVGNDDTGEDGQGSLHSNDELAVQHNFSPEFLKRLATALALPQVASGLPKGIQAADIFHYAYAVVSSPGYRKRFEASLRVDFPRLPLTSIERLFSALAKLGQELADLHVLERRSVKRSICNWVGRGPFVVERVAYENGTIWLDKECTQGCRGVPRDAWDYWVGGYQVCDKWLKQRKGRTLTPGELKHFGQIVTALDDSHAITREIDKVIGKHGGWPAAFQTA